MRVRTFVSVVVCVARKLRPCPSYSGRRDRNNSVHWCSLYKGGGGTDLPGLSQARACSRRGIFSSHGPRAARLPPLERRPAVPDMLLFTVTNAGACLSRRCLCVSVRASECLFLFERRSAAHGLSLHVLWPDEVLKRSSAVPWCLQGGCVGSSCIVPVYVCVCMCVCVCVCVCPAFGPHWFSRTKCVCVCVRVPRLAQ